MSIQTATSDNNKLDINQIRHDFPILQKTIRNKPLIYLDNAATTQKPQAVIDALVQYYTEENANIHRGVHLLSQEATFAYERTRGRIRHFINARSNAEIVFVRGTTEGINLVANSYGRQQLGAGDEIIISHMEHHSNIVPWQLLCQEKGAHLKVVPINEAGEFIFAEYEKMLSERTKLVAITHVSNALGSVTPLKAIIDTAHTYDVPVLVDGAQGVPHMSVDVTALDCDFYAFSGHKLFGPTGIGVLYGKECWLETMPPYESGGSMIKSVSFDHTTYAELPTKFEAGTPNIAGAIGLGAAIDYINELGIDHLAAAEAEVFDYGIQALHALDGIRLIGTAAHQVGVLSFIMETAHPHDIGTILDTAGVAIRTGHHCAQPVMHHFGVPATCRASLAIYNTREDIDALVAALHQVQEVLG